VRSELDAAIAALDAVVALPDPSLVVDLGAQLPGGAQLSELKLGGGGAYFLDRENGRVYAFPLDVANPQPVPLFEAGAVVGTEPVGRPLEIAWAQDLNALVVLDDGRRFIVTDAGRPATRLTVRDAQALGSTDDIFYGNGNLYILDKASNQVWRYLPSAGGFDSERDPLLGPSDISSASELAVAEDVYLLGSGEEILRFEGGAQQAFDQAGIDQPVSGPTSAVIMPAQDRMLVADQGGDRIVVFTLDGRFVKQLKSAAFTDLRAINLDRGTNELYILNGNALYKTPLPPLE
jgi:DNA-binding beta-propeller fold protein YncE